MAMSSISRYEYLREIRTSYLRASRAGKSELLAAAESVTGLHRKSIIRFLRPPMRRLTIGRSSPRSRGPRRRYTEAFHDALLVCWHAANDICAERLEPFLPELTAKLEACGELVVSEATRELLVSASISTVARHLAQAKRRSRIPLSTTKPGSLLKSQIAIRRGRWDESNPGWLESDTVAHGGDSGAGQFIHSYNFVDIYSGWVELEATMGMGDQATVAGFDAVRRRFPFPISGIDSDNGREYINNPLYRYCQREGLSFTRSRPYKKNDNAHVEQKNWEAIRRIVGYARLDTQEQREILSLLYQGPLRRYLNYFQPTRKRKAKHFDTATGTVTKHYFEALTPYQRVMTHPDTIHTTKELLASEYNQLNPVQLLAEIRTLIDRLNKALR